uniref:Uncharacterized protein n=1 Tax=Tetranychus urticae TaxID=32264 RepID=T1JZ44_TETUR
MRKNFDNKLYGRKKLPRKIVVDRVRIQHETRMSHRVWGKFTNLHRDLVLDLFALALSHYSEVRAKAHAALSLFKHPFGYRLIASELTKVFAKKRAGETEEIQGALSILLNHHTAAFMGVSDWECVTPLWLSLINTEYSEKPAIIVLIEQLSKHAFSKLQPLLINFEISTELQNIGKQLYTRGILPNLPMPSEEEINKGMISCQAANKANRDLYESFVHSLVDSIESGKLHWRHLQFAFLLLQSLIRKDIKFPIEGVRILVKNLINDHISIRRICINGVAAILRQHKRKIEFEHTFVDYNSDDVKSCDWLYIRPEIDYMDETVWKSTKFVNSTFISPTYCPHEGVKYYTDAQALPARNLDSVGPDEAVILEFFLDKAKVTKLLDFITLDDKKTSLLGPRRYKLFQGLFCNFGITPLDCFRDFLENMTLETKDNIHKCGCDILTGLVRGSKYWPYKDIISLRQFLEPVMKKLLKIISRETTEHYVEFCSFGFRRLDGRRFSWLLSYLIEDPLCSNDTAATSFQSFSRLKILSDVLTSQCWRAMPYIRLLFDHILKHNHLKNSYQNIRQLIGCSLTQLLQFDNDFFNSANKTLQNYPKIDELLAVALPELEAACINDKHNSVDEFDKDCSNLVTTICYWIHPHLSLNPFITRPLILQLVPIVCEIKYRAKDDELTASAHEALNSIGQCSINEKFINAALGVCQKMKVNKSWHTRVCVISFLQLMVSSNLFTLMNDPERNQTVANLIFDLLQDDRLEVREKAAGLLGGLIHYQFIKVDKTLINRFKRKCARKLTRSTQNFGYDSSELNEKHGGALGLCSIVHAYPYDVPEFLPDVLMFLGDHLHDPQPIPTTIRKALSDFKRTHHDNWRQHKEKFNEDQLAIITDLLVSPNYYA